MPSPALNTVVRRPDLGLSIVEMMSQAEGAGYIGTKILPIMPTTMNSGVYPVIPKEAMMKEVNPTRAPKTAYIRTNYEYERGTFTTQEYGVEEVIDDVEREMMDQEMSGAADLLAATRASGFLMRAQEERVSDMLFSASAATRFGTTSVTNEWDDFANATPISDIKAQLDPFRKKCGQLPSALIVNWNVFNNLTQCAEITDQIKYTFPGLQIRNLTEAQMAQVLGVPALFVAGGLTDTNGFGLASDIQDIWSDEYAALVRINTGTDMMSGGLGRTFMWTKDAASPVIVEQYREEQVRGDVYRVRQYLGETLFSSVDTAGAIVTDVAKDNIILFDNITT